MVRGRVGEEVHLVTQGALVQIEVDRRGVAAIAPESHVPAAQLRVVLDVLDVLGRGNGPFEVPGDELVGVLDLHATCPTCYVHSSGARAPRSPYSRRSRAAAMLHMYRLARVSALVPITCANSRSESKRSTGAA